ncbi:hypothetical protein RHGRI_005599 [Rhododendron griersonianum]|uniref:Protein FAR1-RELATED SEQUENCE n=1 Tax=Rhododendron griersonianum TaxID=479676 RepID=A0AAV6LCW1_9ERIC|nr:hypothetical protein RHGRI_005599 [Rhododendron griersonianum]
MKVMDPEASCLRGEFQSRRKLDFEDDGDLLEINVVSVVSGDEGEPNEFQNSTPTMNHIDSIHSKIAKESIPQLDMEFGTEEAAYQFYNAYAYKAGFSIRRSKEHKDTSGQITSRTFCCSCEGKRGKDKRDANVKIHRPETRFGCLAKMKIRYCRVSQKYIVFEFGAVHTHTLCTPSKSHLFKSHMNFAPAQALEADMANDSGIAPKAIMDFMAKQAGGRESLGFIPQDYKNYLRSKRRVQMKMGDTGGVLEYLQKMQLEDPNFFYAIQVDEDDLITNIFWADAKMMADYGHFGDVVCFDTTYRKHKDGRPFAMFVGVNHHKQTTIFGAALLYDETADTFSWLFDTFCTAMNGKKPKTILTDQDAAMAKALVAQWPETIHRLCIWHIFQNAAKQLSGVFAEFKDFAKDFSSCVYDYEEEDDFIIAWNQMLGKCGLEDNDWLRRTLIDDHRYEELKADFRATQSTPCLSFPVLILQHATDVFTPEVFKLLNAELCKAWDCDMDQCSEDGTVTTYKITPHGKSRHHIVTYDSIEGTVSCSCKKFEFGGILCAHALKVLGSKNVVTIPDRYILKRWTMNAKSGNTTSTSASSIQDDPKAMMGIRYKELCRLHTHLATRAAESEKAYEIALDGLHKILEEVETILGGVEIHETFLETSHEQNDVVEDDAIIHDEGTGNKVKGLKVKERTNGKSSKRPKSALEKATRNKRKPQAKPSSDGANYISGPVGQTMFVSPQYFTQQHNTQIHNPRLDVPLERNTLTPLSHLSLLTQQSQLGNKKKPQAKAFSNGANSINGPVGQTMFVSPQYFTQQHNTQIHNPRLDVPHLSLGRSPHGYEATYFHSFQDNSQQK